MIAGIVQYTFIQTLGWIFIGPVWTVVATNDTRVDVGGSLYISIVIRGKYLVGQQSP